MNVRRSFSPLTLVFAAITALAASGGVSHAVERAPFDPFWAAFQQAVTSDAFQDIAERSRFPIEMPYGASPVTDGKDLRTRFGDVFDGEADAAACFAKEPPQAIEARYEVACPPKGGDEAAGKPIIYRFEWVDGAWKFTGIDNINE